MSPHAIHIADDSSSIASTTSNDAPFADHMPSSVHQASKSRLDRSDDDEIHDVVCVGFGPAALAIAIALHDALESDRPNLSTPAPKVRFLERQDSFAWHAGMLLPGAKMQITFVKDLATLRNPRSRFTFLNYLHHHNRLAAFTNLGTFLPRRIEYEDYMRWCAAQFESVVDYRQDVERVEAGRTNPKTGAVESFRVTSVDLATGHRTTVEARHVVIAAGGKPRLPDCIPANHPRVLHSSQYATHISTLFPADQPPPARIAVIGGGQSAAEVFHNIPTRFPGAQSMLFIRGAALKPSDDSPFVNEVFDPSRVDDIYAQDPDIRAKSIAADRATNYGVVRLELLEEIYADMYAERLALRRAAADERRHGSSSSNNSNNSSRRGSSTPEDHDIDDAEAEERAMPRRILKHREVVGVRDARTDAGRKGVELSVRTRAGDFARAAPSGTETVVVDAVVVASGYRRDAHEGMLAGLRDMMPGGGREESERWAVNREYRVEFANGAIKEGDAGVWLQGCNEGTHGLSDSLLSILAVRGGEMVESIFGAGRVQRV